LPDIAFTPALGHVDWMEANDAPVVAPRRAISEAMAAVHDPAAADQAGFAWDACWVRCAEAPAMLSG